jgi:pSer/pThr/pTyr-binding forkhead associated (FHA) protein
MSGTPRVQLSLKGRLLSEVPFAGALLRIGRMRENDIVVNNLAVSRFHATLRREGDGFVLEDLGSENGTQVNGARINGSHAIEASDVIQLGKYELRIVTTATPHATSAPAKKASDAWDASQTYLALDGSPPKPVVAAPVAAAAPAPAPAPVAEKAAEPLPMPPSAVTAEHDLPFDFSANEIAPAELASVSAEVDEAPDPEGVFAFGEDDLAGPDLGASLPGPRDLATDPLAASRSGREHTALFDFGISSSALALEEAAPAPASEPALAPIAAAVEAQHAGLIIQRKGKLHQLRAWDAEELCVGRAADCQVVLPDAGVSRRHAAFRRSGDRYEVVDLGSVNGVTVNGKRVKQHVLAIGDVVRIESFDFTFVLDRQPIGSEVAGPAPAPVAANSGHGQTRFAWAPIEVPEDEPFELAPLAGDPVAPPDAGTAPSRSDSETLDVIPFSADLAPASAPLPELDLVADGGDELEEKELVQESGFEASPSQQRALEPLAAGAPVVLELALDAEQLPPALRRALAELGKDSVRIPASVTIAFAKPAK